MLTDTWLERPACRVFVRRRESRDGHWVVLLHGAGADGAMFDPQVLAVPDDWGIACWDARGHGRSTLTGPFRYADLVDDLAALVDTLQASRLCLIGQSMGGHLAQTHAERNQAAVDRVVLIGCVANHAPLRWADRLRVAGAPALAAVYPWRALVRQAARASCVQPSGRRYAAEALERIGRARFADVIRFNTDALQPDATHRMPVPILALLGDHDSAGRIRAKLTDWSQRDPSVRFVMVPDAGHIANLDAADFVNAEIARFLGW